MRPIGISGLGKFRWESHFWFLRGINFLQMNARRRDGARRLATLAVLAAFVGLPVASSWALVVKDESPLPHRSLAFLRTSSPSAPQPGIKVRRGWVRKALLPRTACGLGAEVRAKAPDSWGFRSWTELPQQKPTPAKRLEFCSEFTKPDSLRIRLMGTPKNHRSPPA